VIQDIFVGTGAAATAHSTVTVRYIGLSWSNRQKFDASADHGGPQRFSLDQVVKGWQQGMTGMKEGGRRELIIPPSLGYGPAGQGPIGPNETLVFVVDLVKVEGAGAATP
jgi:peptidylprolyl isomerase